MAKQDASEERKSLKRKKYDKELRRLQAELCKLQDWVKYKGLRVIVVFEGRGGSSPPVEAESHGPGVFPPLVRLFACQRSDA